MHAKELERLLATFGVNPSAFDVVTRSLRKSFSWSTAGRGMNARSLTDDEVAWLLAAYAGSETAARAAENLSRLIKLEAPRDCDREFLPYFRALLAHPELLANVREVRVCRNIDLAVIRYTDGREVRFARPDQHDTIAGLGEASFRSEGVIPGGFLRAVAAALHDADSGEMLG